VVEFDKGGVSVKTRALGLVLVFMSVCALSQVFVSASVSLGYGFNNEVVVGSVPKNSTSFVTFGPEFSVQYGMRNGLKIGAVAAFYSMILRLAGGDLNAYIGSVGVIASYRFNLMDVATIEVLGNAQIVPYGPSKSLSPLGLSGDGNLTGYTFGAAGKMIFALQENVSIAAGAGVEFYRLEIPLRQVTINSVLVPVSVTLSYEF